MKDMPQHPVANLPGIGIKRILFDPFDAMIMVEWTYSGFAFRCTEYDIRPLLDMLVMYENYVLETEDVAVH